MEEPTKEEPVKEEEEEEKKSVTSVNSLDEGGPWGLVIIISAFMLQVFTFGITGSYGIIASELLDYFDNDVNGVSLLASVCIACFMGGGLLANSLASRFSHRSVVLVGSTAVVVGLFVMSWLDSLTAMIPFYGVLVGLGGCFAYSPSHTLSGLYYNKYRSLATGLATSGSGFGCAIFPPLVSFLIDTYSWRGALIFLAGLNMHNFIFALLLRPPPDPPVEEGEEGKEISVEPLEHRSKLQACNSCLKNFCICDWGFHLYLVSNILWNIGGSIYITFGPDYFQDTGLSSMDASIVMTLFGVGQFAGGIVGGIVGNIPQLNRLAIYVICCLIGGCTVFLFPVIDGMAGFATLSCFFGLSFGILLGLLIIVMTDIIGTENLGIGFGYVLIADGLGGFIGPPIAGMLQDEYGGYTEALYVSGVIYILAGPPMLLIPLMKCLFGEREPVAQEARDEVPSTPSPPSSPRSPLTRVSIKKRKMTDVEVMRGKSSLFVRSLSVKSNEDRALEDQNNPRALEARRRSDLESGRPVPASAIEDVDIKIKGHEERTPKINEEVESTNL